MSTQTVEIKDPDIIEIPPDIQLGFDTDGMPRTEPSDTVVEEVKDEAEAARKAELEQMRRERDEATQRLTTEAAAKTKAEAEAKEARDAAEAVTGKLGKTEQDLLVRTHEAWNAHFAKLESEEKRITDGLTSLQNDTAEAKKSLRAAIEAQDIDSQVALQERIAQNAADLRVYQQGQSGIKAEIDKSTHDWNSYVKTVKTAEAKPKPEPKVDPVVETKKPAETVSKPDPEAWINQFPKKTTGEWLKAHKDYVTDEAKHKQLMDFASEWYNEGNPLHTKDFVAALTERFAPEEVTTMTEEAKPEPKVVVAKSKAPAAAPVSRGGSVFSSTNLDAKQVRLPPDLAAFCKSAGLDPASYALSVVEEIKSGKKPKEWLDPSYDRGIR